MTRVWTLLVTVMAFGALASVAVAHPERSTEFPDHTKGSVPKYSGHNAKPLIVCKSNSRKLIRKIYKGKKQARKRRTRLRQYKKCRFRHIQSAVNRAKTNDRIQILPGVYREKPSRKIPVDQAECRSMFEVPDDGDAPVPTYEHQVKCPNARNLIAIIGDSLADPDRECDQKCNLLIEGMGRKPKDVFIEGDRLKKDVIRGDRADGLYLRNVWVEQGAFNNVDLVETNGFRLRQLVTPYGQNYGVLTFASDNGVYEHIEAFGNGDSGIYPGSGPEGHCQRYGIEIRNVNSHHNVLGYSGTAGNGTCTHNSTFHNNNAGISDDSFASGHPGMPQDCSKWNANEVYSNNENYFTNDRDAYCKRHAVREAQEGDRLPAVPGAGRLRLHPLRGQREHHPGQRDLRQLALGRAAVLGPGRGARGERPGQAVRHLQRQPLHRQPDGAGRERQARCRTASTSSGTSRASTTAGSATSRPAAPSRAIPRSSRSARWAPCSRRRTPPRPRPRRPAPPGIRKSSRTRPAAPGSRPPPARAQ